MHHPCPRELARGCVIIAAAQGVKIPGIGMEVERWEQAHGFLISVGLRELRVLHQFFGQRFDLDGRHVAGDQRGERGGTVVWSQSWRST